MSDTDIISQSAVLIVDADILSRHALAGYLRDCGYVVVEAANTDEAVTALQEHSLDVDIILCAIEGVGSKSGFELANWVRQNRPELEVRLAGSLANAADTAADLCERGPQLAKPSDPHAVVDYINHLRAVRVQNQASEGTAKAS